MKQPLYDAARADERVVDACVDVALVVFSSLDHWSDIAAVCMLCSRHDAEGGQLLSRSLLRLREEILRVRAERDAADKAVRS